MRVLLVLAHPVEDSLTRAIAARTAAALQGRGHQLTLLDLYAEGFDPVMSRDERLAYRGDDAAPPALAHHAAQISTAEAMVLCFPTWWYGMPAILKGWFDRAWSPGVVFDHVQGGLAIRPKLTGLRQVAAITTLGGPWWADRIIMRGPVKKALRHGTLQTCAPQARFRMLSLYGAEAVSAARLDGFCGRIDRMIARW